LSSEAAHISEKVSLPVYQFAVEVDGFKPYAYAMKKTDRGTCVFLSDKLCSIYQIRPLICRFYPFRLRNLGDNRYLFGCTRECPGLGKGPLLERVFFERIFRDFLDSMRRDLARNRIRSTRRS